MFAIKILKGVVVRGGGLLSYLRYLCLFTYSGVQYILCYVFVFFFFVLYTLCSQFLSIVHFWLPFGILYVYRMIYIYFCNQYISLIKHEFIFFTVDATSGTGTVYPSGVSDFNPVKIVWDFEYLTFQSFDIECTWWRLF